ncbi:MAG: DMT family transporter [Anaerovoracaceae bacterium]
MSKKMQSNILLLITAFIWGSAFVAQKSGMDYIEPFTYNGIRTFIGGLVLIPVIMIMGRGKSAKAELNDKGQESKAAENKLLIIGGICCGAALFVASSLQQFGVSYTTAGKAGFITTLYVVIVPIISILIGKRVRPIMWLCVLMGAVGLYLLCMTDASFRLQFGDMLVLLCAFAFSVHIMVIDYFSPKVDGVKLSCIQFLFAGLLGIICMFIFEDPDINAILDCWLPILYAGVLSCGIGYTLQVVAQKHAEPTVASLLMSLESVFAVISGAVLLHESMSIRELSGCIVIFAAVIIAQLPEKNKLPDQSNN